jgi:hypothetical protein
LVDIRRIERGLFKARWQIGSRAAEHICPEREI